MAWDKEWTEGEYTQEDVKLLGETITKAIRDTNGEYIGKITEIAGMAGYPITKAGKLQNYGGIYRAIQEAKKQYNIISKNKGRSGNAYTLKKPDENIIDDNKKMNCGREQMIINALKTMVDLIDLDNITIDEAKGVLKSIRAILK